MQQREMSQSILPFIKVIKRQRKLLHQNHDFPSLFSFPFMEKRKYCFVIQHLSAKLFKKHARKIKLQNATFVVLPKMVMVERMVPSAQPF